MDFECLPFGANVLLIALTGAPKIDVITGSLSVVTATASTVASKLGLFSTLGLAASERIFVDLVD